MKPVQFCTGFIFCTFIAIVTEQHSHISCDYDSKAFCTFPAIAQAKVCICPEIVMAKQFIRFLRLCQQKILYISGDCASKTVCKHILRLCQQNILYTYPATMPVKLCVYIACEYASTTFCVHFLRLCQQNNLYTYLAIVTAKHFVYISCDCDSKTVCMRILRLRQQNILYTSCECNCFVHFL